MFNDDSGLPDIDLPIMLPGPRLHCLAGTLKMNIFPDKTDLHDPYWINPGDENSCR
jgi:hypothetical protein